MSKIYVWTSDGCWSKEISGLDKVFLMKVAIRFSGTNPYITVDGELVETNNWESFYYDDDDVDYWKKFKEENPNLDVARVKFFTMRLSTLQEMVKTDHILSPKYSEIIDAAKVPASAPTTFCLMLKFENE